jgi:hypothetical protein
MATTDHAIHRIRETTTALEANEHAASAEIDQAMDNIIKQVAAAVNHRREVLQKTLKTQVHDRKTTLVTQLSGLQAVYTACQTTQTQGTHALTLGDIDVIQCNYYLGQSTEIQLPTLDPAISPEIPCAFDDHGAVDTVCRDVVATIGRVGLDPPVLHGYTNINPEYLVNHTISENKPIYEGEDVVFHVEPNVPAGLTFDSATGILSGTPGAQEATVVTARRTITVRNSAGSAQLALKMTLRKGLSESTKAFLAKYDLSMSNTEWQ